MSVTEVRVRRVSFVSSKPFEVVVDRLTAVIGRPDIGAFHRAIVGANSVADLEDVVRRVVGSSELMEFVRFDAGEVLRKGRTGGSPKILRLVVGNPVIMKQMADTVPDAASYAPVTILIDERDDGVHLSYDSMESLIAPYSRGTALLAARDLDAKVETLLEEAAR